MFYPAMIFIGAMGFFYIVWIVSLPILRTVSLVLTGLALRLGWID